MHIAPALLSRFRETDVLQPAYNPILHNLFPALHWIYTIIFGLQSLSSAAAPLPQVSQ
jgi:hypothetical protein